MNNISSKRLAAVAVVTAAAVIVLDQLMKFWVKTNFYLGEDVEILSWFHLRFIQNNGMAFGLDFLNKHVLTFLRFRKGQWINIRL